ncbi:MAG TPA: sigma-70 family RNA polymerase sigma factor [Candidatus Hydrogenedentes bacterium]|nr:sigma-70 family RNA polymerase sigma factor [Candidatus Hydrogenedentota bacterium]HPG70028.1 sigma-70 family RNA polymerase sigma factor [Candidatus Hydrogenedentota bacterium]
MSVPLQGALLYDSLPVEMDVPRRKANVIAESESALVSRARSGDYAAFDELVQRYRNDVFALAYHFLRDREEAWDISQEVFIKAHRGLSRFRGDASFKTWLLRITTNQCKDRFKKRGLKTVSFDDAFRVDSSPSPLHSPRHILEAKELGEAIDKAVAALPPKHQTAFVLREYEGLSYDEMAQVMNCSIGTVMSRLHHARRKLQHSLARMGVVENTNHG